mgnify:CR=1 FL=1
MFINYPDVVGVVQMCEMLGNISTKQGYRLLHNGVIPYIKIGREYKIAKTHLADFMLKRPYAIYTETVQWWEFKLLYTGGYITNGFAEKNKGSWIPSCAKRNLANGC